MARRVNTKFLAIFTVVVLGVLLLGLGARQLLVHESPEKYIGMGTRLMAEHKYAEAAENFQKAALLDPKNADYWVAFGDAENQLSPNDVEFMRKAREAWDKALAVDPKNKAALDRMMQFWSDVANLDPTRPDVFDKLHDTAQRLFEADPKNTNAEAATYLSVIRPWLGGVEKDEHQVDEAIAKVVAMIPRDPANADLPMFAAEAKIQQADRLRQRDLSDQGKKTADGLVAAANKLMDDSLKAQPTAAMYYSAAQVQQAQAARDTSGDVRKKMRDLLLKARELCKIDDPLYVYININAARAVGDRAESEKILRSLLQNRPDDQTVRLAVAEQLASSKDTRAEALALLDKPFTRTDMIGPKAYLVNELEVRTLAVATNLRLDQYATETDPAAKAALEKKINQGIDQIVEKDGDRPRSLRLRGKLLSLQGKKFDAIQILERARALAEKDQQSNVMSDRMDRWEVVDLLARAYVDTKQTGRAKTLLSDLVTAFPNYDPARILLAQLLIREGDKDLAQKHVQYLEKEKPNDPEIIKLKLQMLDPAKQQEAIKESYARLPETNRAQILDKVNAAMVMDQKPDANRLMKQLWEQNKADVEVVRTYIKVARMCDDPELAAKIAKEASAADPKNEILQAFVRRTEDTSPGALLKIRREEAADRPPFQRELILADCDRIEGKFADAQKHYDEAQKIQPKNEEVAALIFNNLLQLRNWDQAEKQIDRLARANQDQVGGLLFRYRLSLARGDNDAAVSYARALTQKAPEFGQSWLALGQALQVTGNYEEALTRYQTALEKQSDSAEAFRGIIDCYYNLGRPADAKRYIAEARKTLPDNRVFQEIEINHELTYGSPEKAVPAREEAVKKNPDHAQPYLALGQAYLAVARADVGQNKLPEAMGWFDKARKTFKQGVDKFPDEIAFYAYFAETAARSREFAGTEDLIKALIARPAWKDKVEPQQLLAEFYNASDRPADAEKLLRALVAKNPANVDLELRLAQNLSQQKKNDDALKALQANPADPRVAQRRVEILLAFGKTEEAEKAIDDVLVKTPNNVDLLTLAGSIDAQRQDYELAEKRLNRALQLDPKNAKAHYNFGLMRMSQPKGNLDQAIAHLTAARDSAEVGLDARFALADVYRRKGDQDGAIRELESALQAQPMNRKVRLALLDAYAAASPPRWPDVERVIREAKGLPQFQNDPGLLLREAQMLAARNNAKDAIARMNEAVKAAPRDLSLRQAQLNLMIKVQAYPDVIATADQLIAQDKNLWWAYQARAVAKRFRGNKEEAIADFQTALDVSDAAKNDDAALEVARTMSDVIGPDEVILRITKRADQDPRWKIMMSRLLQAQGKLEPAVKALEQVLAAKDRGELKPADKETALRFGGTLYLLANNPEAARKCYVELLEMTPDDLVALNNLACLLVDNMNPPRPQEALKYSTHAYELLKRSGQHDVNIMDTHGWMLTLAGQTDAGIDVLRQVNDARQMPEGHFHLGMAYLQKEFPEEAQRELDMASELLKRAKANKQAVDQNLEKRIEDGMAKANTMLKNRKQANAPTNAT